MTQLTGNALFTMKTCVFGTGWCPKRASKWDPTWHHEKCTKIKNRLPKKVPEMSSKMIPKMTSKNEPKMTPQNMTQLTGNALFTTFYNFCPCIVGKSMKDRRKIDGKSPKIDKKSTKKAFDRKSTKMNRNWWKPMKIDEKQRKWTKIDENRCKSMRE